MILQTIQPSCFIGAAEKHGSTMRTVPMRRRSVVLVELVLDLNPRTIAALPIFALRPGIAMSACG